MIDWQDTSDNETEEHQANIGNFVRLVLYHNGESLVLNVYVMNTYISGLTTTYPSIAIDKAKEQAENLLMNFIHNVVTGIGGE